MQARVQFEVHALRVRQAASVRGPGTIRAWGGINAGLVRHVDRLIRVRIDFGRPGWQQRKITGDTRPSRTTVSRTVDRGGRKVIDDGYGRIPRGVVGIDVDFLNRAANRQAVLRPS